MARKNDTDPKKFRSKKSPAAVQQAETLKKERRKRVKRNRSRIPHESRR